MTAQQSIDLVRAISERRVTIPHAPIAAHREIALEARIVNPRPVPMRVKSIAHRSESLIKWTGWKQRKMQELGLSESEFQVWRYQQRLKRSQVKRRKLERNTK